MAGLTPKEGLYQEEQITARISGRSHLIKEKGKKLEFPLWGGGQQDGYPSRAPLPQLAELPPKWVELPFLTMWLGLRVTPSVRQWSAKCLSSARQGVT